MNHHTVSSRHQTHAALKNIARSNSVCENPRHTVGKDVDLRLSQQLAEGLQELESELARPTCNAEADLGVDYGLNV